MKENKEKSFKQKLIDARKKINNPKKGGKVSYQNRSYVTLQDLYDEVLPPLLEEGLLLTNHKEYKGDNLVLITKIEDADTEEAVSTFSPCNTNLKIQDQGSEFTYLMRYNLGCLLAIRTDFDDDGESVKNEKPSAFKKSNNDKLKILGEKISKDRVAHLTQLFGKITQKERNELFYKFNIHALSELKNRDFKSFFVILEEKTKKYEE